MKIKQNFVSEVFWPDKQPIRQKSITVTFDEPFKERPFVILSLESLDEGQFIERSRFEDNGQRLLHTVYRIKMTASNVSTTGFVLELSTWNNNMIYSYRISWTAISPED